MQQTPHCYGDPTDCGLAEHRRARYCCAAAPKHERTKKFLGEILRGH